jgi:hypothetical protein
MQDGLLINGAGGDVFYFVRRSYERARDESPNDAVYPMSGYVDAAEIAGEPTWGGRMRRRRSCRWPFWSG